MRRQFVRFVLAATLLGPGAGRPAAAGSITIDFEDKSLPSNSYDNGSDLAGGFTSGGAFFNNDYDPKYSVWDGWSYSNVNNTTTPGYTNQYAAITGTGVGGSGNYAVAFDSSPNDSFINLPDGTSPLSVYVTNTTYTYLSMLNGDISEGGYVFAKKFSTGDFFKLEITGFSGSGGTGSALGVVDFFLADYASPNDRPVNTWSLVDLSSLAGSRSLSFGLSSSDNGTFGMNTPAFFALDDLTLDPPDPGIVPEPGSALLLASGMLGLAMYRPWRRGLRVPSR